MSSPAFSRILPFALFMVFIGAEEVLRFLSRQGFIALTPETFIYLYPLRAISAGLALFLLRSHYSEISVRDLASPPKTLASLAAGVLVFILWINMDWTLTSQGAPLGFNPNIISDPVTRYLMIACRLAGAAIVVPIMEELFWRSFLLRYIIDKEFTSVPIGLFTWPSFLITAVLFGLEHHLFFAGVMAGIIYSVLLYFTKSISHCILSHGITNLLLGIYVIYSGRWHFW